MPKVEACTDVAAYEIVYGIVTIFDTFKLCCLMLPRILPFSFSLVTIKFSTEFTTFLKLHVE